MTTGKEQSKKKKLLRRNEYYDMQDELDKLYAKSKENQTFNKLMDLILDERNIKLAYRNIKNNKGSNTPGVNGKTIRSVGKWEEDRLVKYVTSRLQNFQPMKIKYKEIPKLNGDKRPLGIPTIEDRLIQQCIKQILEPICEAKFHPHSYGFRPNRSAHHAIARSNILINKSNLHYVVDIDIKGFFDNVNHAKLIKQMWTMGIRDKNLISIISKMLKAEIEGKGKAEKGTPQGGILSPLLSNIVLNELDWWISDQWETFETKHEYAGYHKYRALKTTDMKEIRIVRYADDFKIFCKDYKAAEKIFKAVEMWLEERLKLKINKNKSRVVNLRKNYSDFLGFKMKVRKKGNKYVVKSGVSDKAKEKIKSELSRKVGYINKISTPSTINMYNATILGMHNYYSCASMVSKDFYRIGYDLSKRIYNQTAKRRSKTGIKSKAYEKYYKDYNFKVVYVAGVALYPIQGIKYKNAMAFTQQISNYTEKGRSLIHDRLKGISITILKHIMENPIKGTSEEFNDNRISLYCGQQGKCYVTGDILNIGEMEVHHKQARKDGGDDGYKNLVYLKTKVHKLIHATSPEVIEKYKRDINPNQNSLDKINRLRKLVGNCEI